MKTKNHGTAFAYPVAPLMWKSGTRHVLMARAGYVAFPIATSSTVTLSRPKKVYPDIFQFSAPLFLASLMTSKWRQTRSRLASK